ncbi:MAG: RlpA-like double-psi beta-barrel domain-containing protein, partial [Rhodopila sp.]
AMGHGSAQTRSPLAGSFDELFANQGTLASIFTRPDVISRLPPLPLSPDDSAPPATACTSPSESAQPQRHAAEGEQKGNGVASALKKLIAPPAEAETSPAPPPPQTASSAPESPTTAAILATPKQPAATDGPRARPIRVSRLGRAMVRSHTSRTLKVTRAGGPTTRGHPMVRPTVTRLGRLGGGRAVWYQHSGRTASGETYNPNGLTAAHRTLPLGTRVRVVNPKNGRWWCASMIG